MEDTLIIEKDGTHDVDEGAELHSAARIEVC